MRRQRRVLAALALVVALGAQGCAGRACTDVGGRDGVAVEIPRTLFVASGSVAFDVCDAGGCASATRRLGPVPEGPVGRGADVTFDDLGRRFEPGTVTVTVELSDADGSVVATARRDVVLTRYYPNGRACDGDGYVAGSLTLTAGDRS